ncbi:MAG: histidinol-phosphatase HisJ [Candidatus Heimdallarchaeota archaeon]|nr:MAG: histidinol-phosphatase HisJ [Candidatus Heimdallarchaeota archaeon]
MKLWDYHTHTSLCNHATGTIEDYVKAAVEVKLAEVGISDHFPMDLLPEHFHIYAMTLNDFPNYIDEIKRLKLKYNQIQIRISSEVDYFPEVFDGYKKLLTPYLDDFDYIIGSIHAIPWKNHDAIPVDELQAVPLIRELGVDQFYLEYYNNLLRMVKTNFYDVVGHLDLPKKYGLVPYDTDRIWQKVLQLLDQIESNDLTVEINTSGLKKRIKQEYPSEDIIKELITRKIPITLGSDAHSPQAIGFRFEELITKTKKWGLTEICQYSKRERSLVPLK